MYTTIIVEKNAAIATITLNRPDALNSVDMVMREELRLALIDIERDNNIHVVIMTGAGRAFCAGGDLSTMGKWTPLSARKRMQNIHPIYKTIINSEKIYIAAVNGHAAGSGLSLSCCCDFRIAVSTAKFAASFINVGLVGDCGLLYTLPRIIGLPKAKEMILRGQTFTANIALKLGLLTELVETPEQLWEKVNSLAKELVDRSYIALSFNKNIINRTFELGLDDLLDYEAYAQDICFASDEHKNAIAAVMSQKKK